MIDWVASGLTLLGNVILIQRKSWIAFLVFFAGNSLWFVHWVDRREYAALVLVCLFLAQNLWGIYSWRKHDH